MCKHLYILEWSEELDSCSKILWSMLPTVAHILENISFLGDNEHKFDQIYLEMGLESSVCVIALIQLGLAMYVKLEAYSIFT